MSNRIPPKGTEGYKLYWADRNVLQDLEIKAKRWTDASMEEPHPSRRAMFAEVTTHMHRAAYVARTYHETTDYHSFNTK